MIRTIIAVCGLIGAVLWLPVWAQLLCFIGAFVLAKHRAALLLPAILADVLYAPTYAFSSSNLKNTLFVASILIIWYFAASYTRLVHD